MSHQSLNMLLWANLPSKQINKLLTPQWYKPSKNIYMQKGAALQMCICYIEIKQNIAQTKHMNKYVSIHTIN